MTSPPPDHQSNGYQVCSMLCLEAYDIILLWFFINLRLISKVMKLVVISSTTPNSSSSFFNIITHSHCYHQKGMKKKSMADDWVCRTCQHLNFNWRKKCQRCKEPVLSRVRNCATGPRVHNVRPGDWFCDAGLCRAHNFANRQFCFRCGVIRRSVPSFGASVGYQYHNPPVSFDVACKRIASISRRGWTTGDWFCFSTECNAHNYGQRMRCYKCKSLRD